MNCDHARRLLSDQFNRPPEPLPTAQVAVLEAHLQACVACRRFNHLLRVGLAGVRTLPAISPHPRVREAIERQTAVAPWVGFRVLRRQLRQGAGVVGTTLLIIIVTALAAALLRPSTAAPPPTGETMVGGAMPLTQATVTQTPASVPSVPQMTTSPAVSPTADAWTILEQRPLAVPTLPAGSPCPRAEGRRVSPAFSFAIGDGPAYATAFGPDGVYSDRKGGDDFIGWLYQFWLANPTYQGPLLIRGRQIDGPNTLQFAIQPGAKAGELRLGPGGVRSAEANDSSGWRFWKTYTVAPAPGCYAYQVDGEGFSQTIVFQVVSGRPEDLLPLPPFTSLPRQLSVTSALPLGPGQVRLALTGANYLVLRIDVEPTSAAPLALTGPNVRRGESAAGSVVWQPNPQSGAPQIATWDDGRHRYQLTRLDGDASAWAESDLLTVIAAFANAR